MDTRIGDLLRAWRDRRHLSQLALAYEAEVSPRHLSFVETGKSTPSRELIITLAECLQVPLRERNTLLLAAGYAPQYHQTDVNSPTMDRVRGSLQRLLDTHDPYPGVVLDRHWNVVLANRAAMLMVSVLPPELAGPPVNVFRASLHPDGLAAHTVNFDEWATYLLGQLHRQVLLTADPTLVDLEREVTSYPNVQQVKARDGLRSDETPLLVPCVLSLGGVELSMFTTLTTFGSPRDITLDELAIELFFPADDATEQALRALT